MVHSCDGEELEGPAAEAKREVAYFDSQEFHVLLTKCSDVSYVQVLPSGVHPDHNFAADCNMADRKVVADVLRKTAQLVEDAMMEGRVLGSRREGRGFVRMVMQYSVRKGVGVVLDP